MYFYRREEDLNNEKNEINKQLQLNNTEKTKLENEIVSYKDQMTSLKETIFKLKESNSLLQKSVKQHEEYIEKSNTEKLTVY